MIGSARNLGMVLCLLCAAMLAACPGDRMSQSTTEAVDDSLIANKVTLALYSDKQVNGRGMRVESAQGVVELNYSHLKWEFVWEPLEAVRVISYLSNRSSKRLSSFS